MHHYLLHLLRDGEAEPHAVSISVGREVRARELALELLARLPGGRSVRGWRDGVLAFELSAGEAAAGLPQDAKRL